MNNLSESLKNECIGYINYPDSQKRRLLSILYNDQNLSWAEIGSLTNTYANKVRRDAIRLGIKSRDKSDAQKMALESGRHPHPTKDKGHTEEAKIKISDSVADVWEEMDENQRALRKEDAQKRWQEKSPEEIKAFRDSAGEGVRKAAKEGSELERFLLRELIKAGYKVSFHKEHWVVHEKFQIDLYLQDFNIAIEVDGPSHFENIWGEDNLRKNQLRDAQKTGLLLERGVCIVRIRQKKALSLKYKRTILMQLLNTLKSIIKERPNIGNRHIILGDN